MDNQVAAKAVIRYQDKYLIVRHNGKCHAIGGRLDPGETLEDGLRREVLEETGITALHVGDFIHVDEWFAEPEGERKHIVAIFYDCTVDSDMVVLSDEHDAFAWITVDEVPAYGDAIEPQISRSIVLSAEKHTHE